MKLRVLTIAAALSATGYTFVWPSVPAEALTHTCVNDPVHGIQHCAAGIPNVPFILAAIRHAAPIRMVLGGKCGYDF